MNRIEEALLDGLAFAGALLLRTLATFDHWRDRRRVNRESARASDIGALKEERWWGHLLK